MGKEIQLTGQSLGTMAKAYNMSSETFNKNIKAIRPKLDKIAGRKNYRNLTPKQVTIIIEHLGQP